MAFCSDKKGKIANFSVGINLLRVIFIFPVAKITTPGFAHTTFAQKCIGQVWSSLYHSSLSLCGISRTPGWLYVGGIFQKWVHFQCNLWLGTKTHAATVRILPEG